MHICMIDQWVMDDLITLLGSIDAMQCNVLPRSDDQSIVRSLSLLISFQLYWTNSGNLADRMPLERHAKDTRTFSMPREVVSR